MRKFASLDELGRELGQVVGTSEWIAITQQHIDEFARATGDLQWIHVDPVRAAAGPFGSTIAHGFLTLSLLPRMMPSAIDIGGVRMGVNYGLNRVRFPTPVRSGSRVRGRFRLLAYERLDGGGAQLTLEATIELEGSAKPACIAQTVSRRFV